MPYEYTGGVADFGHLALNYRANVQVFTYVGGIQKWQKPAGASLIHIIAIGAGGGGGGGFSAASTNARGGGGGGGTGSISFMTRPAIFVPDSLNITIGLGGAGGAASGAGGGATQTFITYGNGISANVIPNLFLTGGTIANPATGGGAGTGAAAGSAGTGGSVAVTGTIGHSVGYSIFQALPGVNGATGGAQTGAVGSNSNNNYSAFPLSSGAGGAGVNTVNTGFAGGNVVIANKFDFSDGVISQNLIGGTAGSAAAAGDGQNGPFFLAPFIGFGGAGGGSSDGSTGGKGGDGAYGCGGGGGGGGVTGGVGGKGGDGLVIIISY